MSTRKKKNSLKGKSEGSEATKQLGGLGGTVIPPNGVKGSGMEPQKIWILMIFICLEKQFQTCFSLKMNTNKGKQTHEYFTFHRLIKLGDRNDET